MREFPLPDLGEGLEEAEIVSWHVGAGDHVVSGQPLVSVETAKAVVEIPSPWSGRIARLAAAQGDFVKTGGLLVVYEDEGAKQIDKGTVVGELPPAKPARPEAAATRQTTAVKGGESPSVRASPAVRKLASSLKVELEEVSGTGPDGVITSGDVEKAAAAPKEGYEVLRGVRRAMAVNMARSAREVPGSTVTDEADVAHWPLDADVSTRLIRSIVAGCAAAPSLNAWFDGERMQRRLWPEVHVGIAVAGPEGLFVPVIRGVQALSRSELRNEVDRFKRDIASRATPPVELAGATISLSNFGMLGGAYAALAIVPPQVAILGAGRLMDVVRPRSGEVTITRILPLSLTFDHRVVTGSEAVTFLKAVIASLEERPPATDRESKGT